MRLPNTAQTSRPWRIHELTRDFRLEDVWALPTPGGPDDFSRLVEGIASGDPSQGSSRAARPCDQRRTRAAPGKRSAESPDRPSPHSSPPPPPSGQALPLA